MSYQHVRLFSLAQDVSFSKKMINILLCLSLYLQGKWVWVDYPDFVSVPAKMTSLDGSEIDAEDAEGNVRYSSLSNLPPMMLTLTCALVALNSAIGRCLPWTTGKRTKRSLPTL